MRCSNLVRELDVSIIRFLDASKLKCGETFEIWLADSFDVL